ncbi:MAG: hypothetical protein KDA90_17530, partial [Planctomycetaceae bacterium]|nr:hypothetical protein [Planctomycetaceae bacterium]
LLLFWEVPFEELGKKWRFCAKGGDYSWFLTNINTVLNWNFDGRIIAEYTATVSSNVAQARRSSKYYFLPALTCTYRCTDFSLRALPSGCVFTSGARVIIPHNESDAVPLLSSFFSEDYAGFLRQIEKKGKYEPGPLGSLPSPVIASNDKLLHAWEELYSLLLSFESNLETSPYFSGIPSLELPDPDAAEFRRRVVAFAEASEYAKSEDFVEKAVKSICSRYSIENASHRVVSFCIGRCFGRFGEPIGLPECDPFTDLATLMPSLRQSHRFRGATALEHDARKGVSSPMCRMVRSQFEVLAEGTGVSGSDWELKQLGDQGLESYLSKAYGFFAQHIKDYSAAFRKAPIYWQLGTPSSSYSIWIYYHDFTRDTLFQVLKEYAGPKLNHERKMLDRARSEAGADPTRSQRKDIEEQERFVTELAAMIEEFERVAPLWDPNLNDGVIINFAPLWRLVPQNRSWQKECKSSWDKLVVGDCDWTHLAMHLWPERVVPKCVADASLAMSHGLEDVFWEQDERGRFQPKQEPPGGWDPVIKELVAERTSPAVKAALESLLTAPVAASPGRTRKRRGT